MKKNIAMRVAAFLFILTMISTCAFATTFAKYTTSDSATDTARVAKWGVTFTTTGYDVFNTNYNDTVISSETTENVVAPGTTGSLVNFTISGTPEVSLNVAFTADLQLGGWTVDSAYYCPLEITVGDNTYKAMNYDSAAAFEAAVEGAIAAYNKDYAAKTNLSTIGYAPVVSWSWLISGGVKQTDVKDTALGDAAADGNAATISLTVTCTVTQLD